MLVSVGCSVMSDSLWSLDSSFPGSSIYWIYQARILVVVCHSFIFQHRNWIWINSRQLLYHLSHQGSTNMMLIYHIWTSDIWPPGALSAGSYARCTKHGQEELPHVQGQGQQPRVPGCDGAGTDERSYPTSKVRGRRREELPSVWGQGRQPRGATPRPRPGVAAGRSNATPRPGTVARRSNPMSKERWLCRCRRA